VRLAAVFASIALLCGASASSAEPRSASERAFRRAVAHELDRLHALNWRLRKAIARGVPWAPIPHLAVIASCESGANPRAISPGGRYRGAWQFDASTWRGVGGVGDPAAAPFPEQAYRAWRLYLLRGAQPWPVCGRGW
jgi:membrane-bound lytic murein transglycosylase MltF